MSNTRSARGHADAAAEVLESARSNSIDVQQIVDGLEGAVALAVVDDAPREDVADARKGHQLFRRRGVHVEALIGFCGDLINGDVGRVEWEVPDFFGRGGVEDQQDLLLTNVEAHDLVEGCWTKVSDVVPFLVVATAVKVAVGAVVRLGKEAFDIRRGELNRLPIDVRLDGLGRLVGQDRCCGPAVAVPPPGAPAGG